ncbi:restriction modification system DNA specificity domain protein, partial [mine drainage metagenome]
MSEGGRIRLLRTTDITSGEIDWSTVPFCTDEPPDVDKYLLHEGDIVISRAGSVGVSYLITRVKPSVFASYLIRFRPGPAVEGRYLAYFLKSRDYWQQIADNTSGIAIPNVNASKISDIRL